MAVKSESEDKATVHPVEAIVLCLLECNEIYGNLFDTAGTEVACREMGRTIRAFAECLSNMSANNELATISGDASFYEDDDPDE
ncbi:MAG: hypothetical protein CTY19_02080 [Methylomonas sp.]|nr:MAG: hypothetical protein CTY19_02080 [Methylomonas sp.]